jgi:hypothetical protein
MIWIADETAQFVPFAGTETRAAEVSQAWRDGVMDANQLAAKLTERLNMPVQIWETAGDHFQVLLKTPGGPCEIGLFRPRPFMEGMVDGIAGEIENHLARFKDTRNRAS